MSSLYENVSIGVLSIYGDLPYVQTRKIGAFSRFIYSLLLQLVLVTQAPFLVTVTTYSLAT